MNIYVSNLSFAVVDEDLKSYFAEYGEVTSAKVIAELDGATVDGRSIKVNVARPKEDRPARPAYSNNSNSNSNNRW